MQLYKEIKDLKMYSNGSSTWIILSKIVETNEEVVHLATTSFRQATNRFNRIAKESGLI